MVSTTTGRHQSETAILRAGVLDLGARLGLDQGRVEAFGQAVTGRTSGGAAALSCTTSCLPTPLSHDA